MRQLAGCFTQTCQSGFRASHERVFPRCRGYPAGLMNAALVWATITLRPPNIPWLSGTAAALAPLGSELDSADPRPGECRMGRPSEECT